MIGLKDEFNLKAEFYDKIWGRYYYDADLKFLQNCLENMIVKVSLTLDAELETTSLG